MIMPFVKTHFLLLSPFCHFLVFTVLCSGGSRKCKKGHNCPKTNVSVQICFQGSSPNFPLLASSLSVPLCPQIFGAVNTGGLLSDFCEIMQKAEEHLNAVETGLEVPGKMKTPTQRN